ncbi:MAG: hypothetical protein PHW04_16705 [Candidatus Wallbacteria bacterium]|nr:hypothetical protein [Candidatus Wallbacteria bacterium]
MNKTELKKELIEVIPGEQPSSNYMITESLQKMPGLYARGLLYIIAAFTITAFLFSLYYPIEIVVVCDAYAARAGQAAEPAAGTGDNMFMELIIRNQDIGRVETGMEVRYRFTAFPYYDYGELTGVIASIATDPMENTAGGFIYHAKGTLERGSFLFQGRNFPLKQGMLAQAMLITGKEPLFSYFLSKVRN